MDKLQGQADVFINRSREETFKFLCDPDVDPAELTPFEDKIIEGGTTHGVGYVCRTTIDLAARELDCTTRCIEYDPPRRLVTRLEGDLEGTQAWELRPENDGTRAQLSFEVVKPEWLPAYLKDKTTGARWSQRLVEQTLENVKTTLEGPKTIA